MNHEQEGSSIHDTCDQPGNRPKNTRYKSENESQLNIASGANYYYSFQCSLTDTIGRTTTGVYTYAILNSHSGRRELARTATAHTFLSWVAAAAGVHAGPPSVKVHIPPYLERFTFDSSALVAAPRMESPLPLSDARGTSQNCRASNSPGHSRLVRRKEGLSWPSNPLRLQFRPEQTKNEVPDKMDG